ncbi:MAG: DNA polymerase III subunit [Bacillota bacterium]|nr:DNA polymerase III subunit [Bacillota bacterium]
MIERIVGHTKQLAYFERMIAEGNLLHAYLFEGESGVGKKKAAIELSKRILCRSEEDLRYFASGYFPDFYLLSTSENELKTEEVRLIQDFLLSAPARAEKKVVIVDDAEKMNPQAQNKMLKLIEEPPSYAVFFFITSNRDALLPTLLSRLIRISFRNLSAEDLRAALEERGLAYEERLAVLSNGSLAKYLELLEAEDNGVYDFVFGLRDALKKGDSLALYDYAKGMEQYKDTPHELLDALEFFASDLLVWRSEGAGEPELSASRVAGYLEAVGEARYRLSRNQNKELILSNLILKLQGVFS